jgi:hypothetical protein
MHLYLDKDDLSMSKKKYIEEFLREQKIKNKSIEHDIIDFQNKKIELSNKQYPSLGYGYDFQNYLKKLKEDKKIWLYWQ